MANALLMHASDHVALATLDLPAGATVQAGPFAIRLRQPVPFGHKLAVRPIAAGEVVLKYGQPIGRATTAIAPGDHVHVHNLKSLRFQKDLAGAAAEDRAPADLADVGAGPVWEEVQPVALGPGNAASQRFLGYRRRDGRAGVRNHVLVMATVQCASSVVDRIGRGLPEVVAITHPYGCSQLGDDLRQTRRVLEEFAQHPNVGAALLVGLGCETMPTVEIGEALAERGLSVRHLVIQDEGGVRPTVARGLAIARELLAETARAERVPVPLSELVVGVECGGSDAWSGVTANPAVGRASDLLVAAGGTVILSEVPEAVGAEHLLAARAVSPEVAGQIYVACRRYEVEAGRMGVDLIGTQPAPGNIAGGLTTIEEKSLGAIAKGGASPVMEFVRYGVRSSRRGLVVMDTPGNDPESVTGMVAGGAQVVVFTTGRGSPTGCPIAPVIKVASNTPMFTRLRADMDLNAGTVLDGTESLDDAGARIFAEVLAVADGKITAAEEWGAREFAINIIGPRM